MSEINSIKVKDLDINLRNPRTIPQDNELKAVHAIVSINPDWFWALLESLLENGYLPTENILVLKLSNRYIVREGNRRIAALKIIHGFLEYSGIPENIKLRISQVTETWRTENLQVPCTVYSESEKDVAQKIVSLTHAKGQKAGRDNWPAVARARYDRDVYGKREVALDLLENFLSRTNLLNGDQKTQWSGYYPLSVLDEFIKRGASQFGVENSSELVNKYPDINRIEVLDAIVRDIGHGIVNFEKMRFDQDFFKRKYDIDLTDNSNHRQSDKKSKNGDSESGDFEQPKTVDAPKVNVESKADKTTTDDQDKYSPQRINIGNSEPPRSSSESTSKTQPRKSSVKSRASTSQDVRTVKKLLKTLKPVGEKHHKIATLCQEAIDINIVKTPLAFCFVVRSLFELSAKRYCDEHSSENNAPKYQKTNQRDRYLADVLMDIKDHITDHGRNKQAVRDLHGAITELVNPERFLSVTSMNQLIHNPSYSLSSETVCRIFVNIYPMLEAMNHE